PEDPRPIALGLQLSIWLDEEDQVDQGYEQLAGLSDNDRIWTAWAEERIGRNRYDDAMVLLVDRETDVNASPESALLIARCHMARNRFDEALATLAAIPEDGLAQPGVRVRKNRLESQANRWKPLWQDEIALREQEDAADSLPMAEIVTTRGPITVLLLENQAPNTVANFINLAQQDYFNGQRFHDVIANARVHSGDPNSRPASIEIAGTGGPGYRIPDESSRDDRRMHFAGMLAMDKNTDLTAPGRAEPNSGGSRWYITVAPQESRNKEYTVFGRIVNGQEIVDRIRANDEVTTVKLSKLRDKEYVPTTIQDPNAAGDEATSTEPAPEADGEPDPSTPTEG
ncbi:MAG: peptidylprolyl isomerase, partial [Phycisphaerales bacterium]|nr:peptidylprolyl isomerase [Phycisphaerales bacterium]